MNQKLDKPIFYEYIWNEDKRIHYKVIREIRINKCGLNRKEIYYAMFFKQSIYPVYEGEGTPEYWLSDYCNNLFEDNCNNWIECVGLIADDIADKGIFITKDILNQTIL